MKDIIRCDKRKSGYFLDSLNDDDTTIIIPIMKNTLKLKDQIYIQQSYLDLAETKNYIDVLNYIFIQIHTHSSFLKKYY